MKNSSPGYNSQASAAQVVFSSKIKQSAAGYAWMLVAAGEMANGESGPKQYAAKGAVLVKADVVKKDKENRLIVEITIQPGWHINAHQPLQDYLIPTSISLSKESSGWKLGEITYPPALQKKLGFQRETLALYEGKIKLEAELVKTDKGSTKVPVEVSLQTCNDNVCLPPENLVLQIPVNLGQN